MALATGAWLVVGRGIRVFDVDKQVDGTLGKLVQVHRQSELFEANWIDGNEVFGVDRRLAADGVQNICRENHVKHFLHDHTEDYVGRCAVGSFLERIKRAKVRRNRCQLKLYGRLKQSAQFGRLFDERDLSTQVKTRQVTTTLTGEFVLSVMLRSRG